MAQNIGLYNSPKKEKGSNKIKTPGNLRAMGHLSKSFFCFISFLSLIATGTFISQITYTIFISWCFRQVSVRAQHFCSSLDFIFKLRFWKYLRILMGCLYLTIFQMRQKKNGFHESINGSLFCQTLNIHQIYSENTA